VLAELGVRVAVGCLVAAAGVDGLRKEEAGGLEAAGVRKEEDGGLDELGVLKEEDGVLEELGVRVAVGCLVAAAGVEGLRKEEAGGLEAAGVRREGEVACGAVA
jgi:hypothetical protein